MGYFLSDSKPTTFVDFGCLHEYVSLILIKDVDVDLHIIIMILITCFTNLKRILILVILCCEIYFA